MKHPKPNECVINNKAFLNVNTRSTKKESRVHIKHFTGRLIKPGKTLTWAVGHTRKHIEIELCSTSTLST